MTQPPAEEMEREPITQGDWLLEAARLFGDDWMKWRFVCPSCGYVQTPQDYKDAGAPESAVAFSCVGRWTDGCKGEIFDKNGGPCNYAGGGLFRLNPVKVLMPDGQVKQAFAFTSPQTGNLSEQGGEGGNG